MSRFVVVSFAFMGWAFYEMSGGAEFQPPDRPATVAAATPETSRPASAAPRVTAQSLVRQPVRAVVSAGVIEPITAAADTSPPDRPTANPNLRSEVALAQIGTIGAALAGGSDAFSALNQANGVQTASLATSMIDVAGLAASSEEPATGQVQPVALAEDVPVLQIDENAAPDVRQIKASRVNMRQGPGTIYPVLARLLAGDEVIVLEDSGTGWLQLRARKNDQVGWIAASLVSRKRP